MTNNADPDQLASLETKWSGSTLFAKAGHVRVSRPVLSWAIWGNNYKKTIEKLELSFEDLGNGVMAAGIFVSLWSPNHLIKFVK